MQSLWSLAHEIKFNEKKIHHFQLNVLVARGQYKLVFLPLDFLHLPLAPETQRFISLKVQTSPIHVHSVLKKSSQTWSIAMESNVKSELSKSLFTRNQTQIHSHRASVKNSTLCSRIHHIKKKINKEATTNYLWFISLLCVSVFSFSFFLII